MTRHDVTLVRAKELHQSGRLQEAALLYRQVLSSTSNHPEALRLLGLLTHELGDYARAADLLGQSIAVSDAATPVDYYNLAVALERSGQVDQAIAHYRQALNGNPAFAEALLNLGNCLKTRGLLDEASGLLQRAVAVQPGLAEGWNSLGVVLQEQHQLPQAAAMFRRALAAQPRYPQAAANLSWILLLTGNFKEGWNAFEARWGEPGVPMHREIAGRLWDGSNLAGQRILLHAEQGFGDTINFIRYAPMVKARGGFVIFYGPAALSSLLEHQCGIGQICRDDVAPPPYDVHCPLMSLPRVFGTNLETIPANVPYLFADPALVARWKQAFVGEVLKIGLAWAGNPRQPNDHKRSSSLAAFAPLAQLPGVQFYSLQMGAAAAQLQSPPAGMRIIDLAPQIRSFADTAAMIEALDLVVSVDTSVAHLAGALGKPVWVPLAYAADWRWLLDRTDSPWYPTMRLFRQPRPGDWEPPMREIAAQLTARIK
jgi:Flp pilus assembly protein TadD